MKTTYSANLVITIAGLLILRLQTACGLSCLHCDSISHPRFCQVVKTCKPGEVCYAKTVLAKDGYKSYQLGCTVDTAVGTCNVTAASDSFHCLECCSTGLCNSGLCGQKGYPDRRGPICYSCKSRLLSEPCNAIEFCGIDEVCSISQTVLFSEILYSSGCSQEHICEAHAFGSNLHLVGKRAVNNDQSVNEDELSPGNCFRCCDTDMCNSNCSTSTDHKPCSSSPCLNGGSCKSNINSYQCFCAQGYTGTHCDTDIDECASSPCSHGGTCFDMANGYRCICPQGFTGTTCSDDIDECATSPCSHGTCVDMVYGYRCICQQGFTGQTCNTDIDECTSFPCLHGGTCVNTVNGYWCICPKGYTGQTCNTDIDECSSSPCSHGGTCVDTVNGYRCICQQGFTGRTCNTDIDECVSSPCSHGGSCIDTVNGFKCDCLPGYTGDTCTIDLCSQCMNNASCIDFGLGYRCMCRSGFTGSLCEKNIDECASSPCSHGGTCVAMVTGFKCVCPHSYTGRTCNSVQAQDCLQVQQLGIGNTSGVYTIMIPRLNQTLRVLCDMTTDGGGWTVFQYRFNGSVDFYRNFSEYENGFGTVNGEFWMGLKYIYELSRCPGVTLRIDLEASTKATAYETFGNFYLSSGPSYTLRIDHGTGPAGDDRGMSYSKNHVFATFDRDNHYGCAARGHGGWWYSRHVHANLNGEYVHPPGDRANTFGSAESGMIYRDFHSDHSLKSTKMMLRSTGVHKC